MCVDVYIYTTKLMSFDVKGATSLLDLENIWIEKSQVVTVQPKKKKL